MTICIIDYGSGNLHSAFKAFQHAASELSLTVALTSDPSDLANASHIVLPGVGAFGECAKGLRTIDGMVEALEEAVLTRAVPFLGICVGMQLMLSEGHEHGTHQGLGWIEGKVVPIPPTPGLRIPHMGWNTITTNNHAVLNDLPNEAHLYFVHSYHAECEHDAHILATTDYGAPLCACIGRDNLVGTQFHPEKSGAAGLQLIANFLRWQGT